MASTLVQFRADETEQQEAIEICTELGIDLQTYLRMCMSRLVQERGIPCGMQPTLLTERGIRALQCASSIAKQHGISEMTLDEINAEIAAARA